MAYAKINMAIEKGKEMFGEVIEKFLTKLLRIKNLIIGRPFLDELIIKSSV